MSEETTTTTNSTSAAVAAAERRAAGAVAPMPLPPPTAAVRRRQKQSRDSRRLARDPTFLFSLQEGTEHLPHYRQKVKDGIIASADKYHLQLDQGDLDWLEAHNGRFCCYQSPSPPRSANSPVALSSPGTTTLRAELEARGKRLDTSPRYSTRRLQPNTLDNYEKFLRMLWDFLAMIGEYDSMLILLVLPPRQCPSMDLKVIRHFINHRCQQPRSPIFFDDGVTPLKDIDQQHVLAEGTIQNTHFFDSLFAAINLIHSRANQTGSYIQQCAVCFDRFERHEPHGCPHHGIEYPYCNKGNV
eukprot:scaffold6255_cov118-Cylindrotheca_fusiformis.AAC.1